MNKTIDSMLAHLKLALRYCSLYEDLEDLTYDADTKTVMCSYWSSKDICKLYIDVPSNDNAEIIHIVETKIYNYFGGE